MQLTKFLIKLWILLLISLPLSYPLLAQEKPDFRLRVHQLERDYTEEDIKAEILFGKDLAAKILAKYKLDKDEKLQKYLNLLGRGLAAQIGRSELNYYFAVIDQEDINAYACPGGYIFITRGAIQAMENEAQLVGVIAHEIGHIDKRHIVKSLKIRGKENSLSGSISAAIGGGTATARILLQQMTEKAFKMLFEEGISKNSEFEADAFGIEALVALDYDWNSYRNYLRSMEQLIDQGYGKVVSKTHPSIPQRIAHIDSTVADFQLNNNQGKTNAKRFKKFTSP